MSILLNSSTRVLVQGVTGREGEFHARQMIAAGTRVVGGVTPGKGGQQLDLGGREPTPVFNTMREAMLATEADATCIFVPPMLAGEAIMEAAYTGVGLAVCITEGIPTLDVIRAMGFIESLGRRTRLIGPNCPGLATPGEAKIGIMPYHIFKPGSVGLISRSGTLTYEVVSLLSGEQIGQSTVVGIGGDPVIGTTYLDILHLFEQDAATEAVVLCGEIGGSDEEDAAAYIPSMTKPVIGFISGRTAPAGKRMGHAGAIISGNTGAAQGKVDALRAAGAPVADTIFDIPALVQAALAAAGAC